MKNLILIAMTAVALTIFNGCQKEQFNIDQRVDEVHPQEAVKPDVYVEKDYLVFKNYDVYDSVATLLNNSSLESISEFEANLGFKSAFSYRQEILKKFNSTSVNGSNFLKSISKEGYYNEITCEFTYPFHNESRAYVLNPVGKVKIDKTYYQFEGNYQTVMPDTTVIDYRFVNTPLPIKLELQNAKNLKSSEILFNNTTAASQQRLTMRVLQENEAIYGDIIVGGQIVWGIIGYKWVINLRFHSWRQRRLSKSDENTYLHFIHRHLHIGGNQIITATGPINYSYPIVWDVPTIPITQTSPWKAIYYLKLYDSQINPGINPPAIHDIDFDCWSDRLPTPINYVDYPL